MKGRKVKVLTGLKSYLERLEFEDFDLDEYIKRIECDAAKIPTIGMAISGGGWSSAMTGTGALRALDDRFQPAVEQSVPLTSRHSVWVYCLPLILGGLAALYSP